MLVLVQEMFRALHATFSRVSFQALFVFLCVGYMLQPSLAQSAAVADLAGVSHLQQ